MTPSSPQTSPAEPYVPGRHFTPLDGVRGLAILMVVWFHANMLHEHIMVRHRCRPALDALVNDTLSFGWMGVDIFFVLSGFLITGILLDNLGASRFFQNFYVRRTLRIFPLYFVFLTLYTLVFPLTFHLPWLAQASSRSAIASCWFYVANVWITVHRRELPVPSLNTLWSLAVEEQFYLFWPFVVYYSRTTRRLFRVCVAMIAVAPLLRALFYFASGSHSAGQSLTVCRMDALAFGACVALFARDRELQASASAWIRRNTPSVMATIAIAGLVLLNLTWYFYNAPVQLSNPFNIEYTLDAALFSWLLLRVLSGKSARLTSALNTATLRTFGKYSYAMYLLHAPLMYWLLVPLLLKLSVPTIGTSDLPREIILLTVSTLAVYGVARVSWSLIESPFLRLKAFFAYKN